MDIKNLLASEDHSIVIAELKTGRTTAEPEVGTFEAQLNPDGHDINDPIKRPDKKVKIDKPEDNGKIIQVTNGETEENTRTEKVARIALALQKLIVKRAVAFTFGNPVELNAEPEEGTKEEDVLKAVNRVLFDTKSRTLNRKIARNIFSCTEAAERWYPVEKPNENYGFSSKYKLRVAIFSPLLGDKLYPYFDETGDMIAFSREFTRKDNAGVKFTYFETYTEDLHQMWITTNNQWEIVEGYPKVNTIGKIPVIYGRQPAVEWEDVQGLIERLEKLLSNFADTNDYHASPKIFTTGTIVGFAKKGEAGAIIEGEEGATAEYLAWQNAPESVKLEIETLLRMIYTITQTPDISFEAVKGLGAISGIALKLLFLDAHLKVQDKMEIFDDYLQRRLSVVQAYLSEMNTKDKEFKTACQSLTIEPEIVPFMIEDEKAKVDLLVAANGGKPVASQKTTTQLLGWVNDTEAEYEQILHEEGFSSYSDINEPTV
ncbi:MAG: phage portal protein [Bacteroidales bacterium]|jgi:SPP1 family phage portal protein|nr:phage portal protein [Bacteroidales bacterium]